MDIICTAGSTYVGSVIKYTVPSSWIQILTIQKLVHCAVDVGYLTAIYRCCSWSSLKLFLLTDHCRLSVCFMMVSVMKWDQIHMKLGEHPTDVNATISVSTIHGVGMEMNARQLTLKLNSWRGIAVSIILSIILFGCSCTHDKTSILSLIKLVGCQVPKIEMLAVLWCCYVNTHTIFIRFTGWCKWRWIEACGHTPLLTCPHTNQDGCHLITHNSYI